MAGTFIRGEASPLVSTDPLLTLPLFSEASSRIYSPYVFAIGQLIGEIPYSIVCAVLYWVLMVSAASF